MLYIMRHGKTDWNVMHKLQGRTDIPLNDEGRRMAERAAKEYRNVHLDICFCSPLSRAKETAEILLRGRNVPIVCDDRLQEMSFGIYEGIVESFSVPNCPVNVIFQRPAEYKEAFEGAESFEDLFARTGEFLEERVEPELAKGRDVLIVGHGAMNLSIVSRIRKLPREEFWNTGIENCKMIRLI